MRYLQNLIIFKKNQIPKICFDFWKSILNHRKPSKFLLIFTENRFFTEISILHVCCFFAQQQKLRKLRLCNTRISFSSDLCLFTKQDGESNSFTYFGLIFEFKFWPGLMANKKNPRWKEVCISVISYEPLRRTPKTNYVSLSIP